MERLSTKEMKASAGLFVKVDEQKIVLGTLSYEKFPQISFDLMFEKKFELSHNWESGSVYCAGFIACYAPKEYPVTSSSL